MGQGFRSDIEAFVEAVDSGATDYDLLHSGYAEIVAKYPHFADKVRHAHRPTMGRVDLLPWQRRAFGLILSAVESLRAGNVQRKRYVFWFCERTGGVGKTFFTKYLLSCEQFTCGLMANKTEAAAFMYNNQDVCIFDIPRSSADMINYGNMEMINNGLVVSPKYFSCVKVKIQGTVVVVFANQQPDFTKLSQDRWHVYEIDRATPNDEYDIYRINYTPV